MSSRDNPSTVQSSQFKQAFSCQTYKLPTNFNSAYIVLEYSRSEDIHLIHTAATVLEFHKTKLRKDYLQHVFLHLLSKCPKKAKLGAFFFQTMV